MLRPLTLTVFLFALLLVPRLALAQEAATPTVASGIVDTDPTHTSPAPSPAPAPVLAEVDGLRVENLLLKVQQATIVLDKLKADFQTLINSLQKPGYQLTQGPDGKLSYVVAAPVPQTTDAKPEPTPPAASGAP